MQALPTAAPVGGLGMSTDPTAGEPHMALSREAKRKEDAARAQSVLRGVRLPPEEVYSLAERLKGTNEFGYARKLFGRLRSTGDDNGLSNSVAKVGQRHALCTYKDPDLPASDRFRRALEILDEVDRAELTDLETQESLGLRGAIYKRIWQVEGQQADLERSLGNYLRGYAMGPASDQGYTGINAAFVLDQLAREEAAQAKETGVAWTVAAERCNKAEEIRRRLIALLPDLPGSDEKKWAWLRDEWWFYATIAEAHFGLGDYASGIATLRTYNAATGLSHQDAPLERLEPWVFESTITQLTGVARVQAELADLLSGHPEWHPRSPVPGSEIRARSLAALRGYLGQLAPGVDRAISGKVGLALSGGGFRASLFHVGVLAYLAERDALRRVETLSCVSGGAILGAYYYLEVKRLLESKKDADITRQDYVDLVQRLESEFLAGVQTNIRCRAFGSVVANLRTFFQPGYTTTRRLGDLYEAELYSRVNDGRGGQPRYLSDLFATPLGEVPDFKPKYDNWRRSAKVPILVLNATTLNTGHNWQFTASWMGEPPSSIDSEIEGNYRLRRMYYGEAPGPKDQWRHWYSRLWAPPDYQRFRLGDAVAASSCVPGLFDPLVLPDLYDGKTVRLVDGGVYDNQGIASLLEQDCSVMIVSDASGQMDTRDHPSGGRLDVSLRSFSVSMARVRQSQYWELAARRRSGLLKGLVFLHLKKDLDADPVDWRECQDPHDASDQARAPALRGVLTRYGIQKCVQRLLAGIRTDLDSFTEVEACALMTSGYRQARFEFGRQLSAFPDQDAKEEAWSFLRIEPGLSPGPGFDDLVRQLRVGANAGFKVWRLSARLKGVAVAFLLAGLGGLWWLWAAYGSVSLLSVRGLVLLLLGLAASVTAPRVLQLMRFRKSFRDVGLRSVLGAALAAGFKIHLIAFDPIFLRLGRVSRLLKKCQQAKA
jgi:predicted acylesterase/phospholipase RssA